MKQKDTQQKVVCSKAKQCSIYSQLMYGDVEKFRHDIPHKHRKQCIGGDCPPCLPISNEIEKCPDCKGETFSKRYDGSKICVKCKLIIGMGKKPKKEKCVYDKTGSICKNRFCDGYNTACNLYTIKKPTPKQEKCKLKFMVDPDELKRLAYVPNAKRVRIVDPEAIFLMGILGESGRKLVEKGLTFYFEGSLADKLIEKKIAEEVK